MSMRTSLRLYAADLNYPRELQVHTAVSGLVASLSARYLVIERSDFRGEGEVRANISYLSHIPESAVDPAIIAAPRPVDGDEVDGRALPAACPGPGIDVGRR